MARVESAYASDVERRVAQAGDGMVLFVTQAIWETLVIQGGHEGVGPGAILSKAVTEYMEAHGCPEAVDYLFSISGQSVSGGDR